MLSQRLGGFAIINIAIFFQCVNIFLEFSRFCETLLMLSSSGRFLIPYFFSISGISSFSWILINFQRGTPVPNSYTFLCLLFLNFFTMGNILLTFPGGADGTVAYLRYCVFLYAKSFPVI